MQSSNLNFKGNTNCNCLFQSSENCICDGELCTVFCAFLRILIKEIKTENLVQVDRELYTKTGHRCNYATLKAHFFHLANSVITKRPRRPTASRTDTVQRATNGAKGRSEEGRREGRRGRIRERRRRWSHLQVDYHSEKKRGETSSWPENNWATSLRLTFDK